MSLGCDLPFPCTTPVSTFAQPASFALTSIFGLQFWLEPVLHSVFVPLVFFVSQGPWSLKFAPFSSRICSVVFSPFSRSCAPHTTSTTFGPCSVSLFGRVRSFLIVLKHLLCCSERPSTESKEMRPPRPDVDPCFLFFSFLFSSLGFPAEFFLCSFFPFFDLVGDWSEFLACAV